MSKDISLDRSIISCFPYDKYGIREAQRKVLEGIDMAIQAGKNYIIIQAPTGVGKWVFLPKPSKVYIKEC